MHGLKALLHNRAPLLTILVLICVGTTVWGASTSLGNDFAERRITIGAKIFRALLAADVDIAQKVDSNGNLRLCLLYVNDADKAEIAAATLRNRDETRIRKFDVNLEISPFSECVGDNAKGLAGIFLTQALSNEQLKALMECAKTNRIVVFSPLEGDVERGVHGGIAVEARVRPYLNMKALRETQVRLKSFFIRVAKSHED